MSYDSWLTTDATPDYCSGSDRCACPTCVVAQDERDRDETCDPVGAKCGVHDEPLLCAHACMFGNTVSCGCSDMSDHELRAPKAAPPSPVERGLLELREVAAQTPRREADDIDWRTILGSARVVG